MVVLNDHQVNIVCERLTLKNQDLQDDLIDHFCCFIESRMNDGFSFEESYTQAFVAITPNGTKEIEEELYYIIHLESQLIMTRFLYFSSFIATFSLVLHFPFKNLHWPYADTLLQLCVIAVLFGVLPAVGALSFRNRHKLSGLDKLRMVLGLFSGMVLSIGMLFKIFAFPNAGFLFVTGSFMLAFLFLPLFFYQLYQKSIAHR